MRGSWVHPIARRRANGYSLANCSDSVGIESLAVLSEYPVIVDRIEPCADQCNSTKGEQGKEHAKAGREVNLSWLTGVYAASFCPELRGLSGRKSCHPPGFGDRGAFGWEPVWMEGIEYDYTGVGPQGLPLGSTMVRGSLAMELNIRRNSLDSGSMLTAHRSWPSRLTLSDMPRLSLPSSSRRSGSHTLRFDSAISTCSI